MLASEAYGEMVIYDADTNVPFPFGDKRLALIKQGHTSGMMAKDPWTTTLFSWLRDVAKITRGLRELPYLETSGIQGMIGRAQTQWLSYPLDTVLEADDPTSSKSLMNYMLLQDSMMTIYRHNLSPKAPMPFRAQSLKDCIDICRTWSVLIRRCAYEGPDLTKEQAARTHRFVSQVLPEFCLHLWRCELLLIATAMYSEVIPLVVASRAIGSHRPVNIELPRYVEGLIKFCDGKGSILDHANSTQWTVADEEVIAFAVGDMHGMDRGKGFPDLWHRPTRGLKRRNSESESEESTMSECTNGMRNGDVKMESEDESDENVTWDDVLEMVKSRAVHQVPNRMAIQNLI